MSKIISTLVSFVNQRPGLEFANYGDVSAYRSDQRKVAQQKNDFFSMLAAIERRMGYGNTTEADIAEACKTAFCGRLSWDGEKLDYCTGQYFCTEYRAAACAVMASVLWDYWREDDESATADSIHKLARNNLGRGIASRWFR